MLAGHDTTATALTYALWVLGHHRDMQDRVAAEAAEIGDRELTPDDVPGSATPFRCCTRRCGCARPPRGSAGWPCATSPSTVPRRGGQPRGRGNLCRAPRSGPVARPLVFDPDRFSPETVQGPRPLAVHPVRGRPTVVHRRALRGAGNHARAGHHHPVDWRSVRWTTISRSRCRSRRSPRARSRPTSGFARELNSAAGSAAPPARTAAARRSAAKSPSPAAPPGPSVITCGSRSSKVLP